MGRLSGGAAAPVGVPPAAGCHSNSFRMSHRNSAIPTSATSTGTGMALAVRSARLSTATRPTAPNTAMRITPAKRRRTSRTPDRAASAAMTSAMPPRSATLSAVPNTEMTHSLTPGGTVSITAPPTAVTGETVGLTRLAVSSPSTTAVPTATSPAPAAHRSRTRRCWCAVGGCAVAAAVGPLAAPAFPLFWSLPASVPSISFPCPSKPTPLLTVPVLSGVVRPPRRAESRPVLPQQLLSGAAGACLAARLLAGGSLAGEQQREPASAVDVFHGDGALMGADDSGDNAQAKPGAAVAHDARRLIRPGHPEAVARGPPSGAYRPAVVGRRPNGRTAAGPGPSASRSRTHAGGLPRGFRRSRR